MNFDYYQQPLIRSAEAAMGDDGSILVTGAAGNEVGDHHPFGLHGRRTKNCNLQQLGVPKTL